MADKLALGIFKSPVIVSPDLLTNEVISVSFNPIEIVLVVVLANTVIALAGENVNVSCGLVARSKEPFAEIFANDCVFVMYDVPPKEFL